MDTYLCQAFQSRDRRARECPGTDWSASSMAKWVICCIHREDYAGLYPVQILILSSQYAVVHFFRFYQSGHGIIRLFFFHIQALVRRVLFFFPLCRCLKSPQVQHILTHLLLVRSREYLVDIQHHYRSFTEPRYRILWWQQQYGTRERESPPLNRSYHPNLPFSDPLGQLGIEMD